MELCSQFTVLLYMNYGIPDVNIYIYICICMYVCMYVCMYACICIYMHVDNQIRILWCLPTSNSTQRHPFLSKIKSGPSCVVQANDRHKIQLPSKCAHFQQKRKRREPRESVTLKLWWVEKQMKLWKNFFCEFSFSSVFFFRGWGGRDGGGSEVDL